MRRIHRPAVFPPVLTHPGRPGTLYAGRLRTEPDLRRKDFPPHWRSPDVRGVLKAICGRGCAYCGDLVGRTGEDVEHYRPKNLYWFLAYSLDNYLPSCRRCNSGRKGTKFPLAIGSRRATKVTSLASEKRLLLDPAADDVESVLRIELTSKRYYLEVVPSAPEQLRVRADQTLNFFRLNDDAELKADRVEAIQEVLALVDRNDPDVVALVKKRASRFVRFGGAVRSVVQQMNPALLPTVEDEVKQLIADLVLLLEEYERSAQPDRDNWMMVRYALAALWCDPPPAVTPAFIGACLTRLQRDVEIKPFADQLAVIPGN